MDDRLAITRSESRVEDLGQLVIVVCLGTEVCCREAVGVEVVKRRSVAAISVL